MEEQKHSKRDSRSNALLLIIGIVVLLLLLTAAVMGGYALGLASVTPEIVYETSTETITEVEEVTREVIVVVTAVPVMGTPTAELIAPADSPTAIETVVPAGSVATPPAMSGESGDDDPLEGDMDFTIFNEAWDLIDNEFDGELPQEKKRLYAAISGSLETLDDQYTRFIRPDVAERMREDLNGSVSGIGAFVHENEEGLLEISRPIDGQPADLAGLLPGDVIVAVDGETAIDREFDEVLLRIRGPEGTSVVLTIVREGEVEPLDFTIVRTVFEVPVVEVEMLGSEDNQVTYLRLTSFTRNAESAVLDALAGFHSENSSGIIFDLRDNPGGFLDQAVAVSDVFLPEGVVLFERGSTGIDKTFDSDNGDVAEQIPLAVLVNAGSASASEIVAGAIQDRKRGIIIGEPTFGKGSVQLVHELSDGSELRVTIARWYTPNNRSISEGGVVPDIEIPTPQDLGGEDDPQLQRAIEFLLDDE
jgi:carboxyl-terminal processing protease